MARSKGNTGNWLMTYSDLVTLLLVFFVLLYVLTPGVDKSVFDNFLSYFQSSIGVMEQPATISSRGDQIEEVRDEIAAEWIDFSDFLDQHGLSEHVEIEDTNDGIKITLSDSLTFNSGSAQLLPAAQLVLAEIAGVFGETISFTEVQGHTDNVPISQNSFYMSNWHLGAARAVSVVEFIRERSILNPDMFKASSFGEYRPVATNETVEGRRRNRRVEIYVTYRRLEEINLNVSPFLYNY